jgi:hypothetical protein
MNIKTETVTPVKKTLHCGKCSDYPELKFTGYSYLTNPMKYPHSCPKCDYKITVERIYPYIDFQ